jgi:hypothetical protein
MLVKMYEGDNGKDGTAEQRYSPAVCPDHASRRLPPRSIAVAVQ